MREQERECEVALSLGGIDGLALPVHETTDAHHGRIKTRRHRVSHVLALLTADRSAPGEPRIAGQRAIAMVEAQVEGDGQTTIARRFFLAAQPLNAPLFARAVRAHWDIEDRLHGVVDVAFHDDLMRLRTGNCPKNMATIKHMDIKLLRTAPERECLEFRRKAAVLDHEYLKAIIAQTDQ